MKKAMVSQPMEGKTYEEIMQVRAHAFSVLAGMDYETANTWFTDKCYSAENLERFGVANCPLFLLAESLGIMSQCHAVYFCKGWEKARGCRVEHEAAKAYGLDIYYEEAL